MHREYTKPNNQKGPTLRLDCAKNLGFNSLNQKSNVWSMDTFNLFTETLRYQKTLRFLPRLSQWCCVPTSVTPPSVQDQHKRGSFTDLGITHQTPNKAIKKSHSRLATKQCNNKLLHFPLLATPPMWFSSIDPHLTSMNNVQTFQLSPTSTIHNQRNKIPKYESNIYEDLKKLIYFENGILDYKPLMWKGG